ncbi:hypothetical protein ACODYM_28955 [Burkholderia gladioli]|uniref:hypothetical protein n=1 Tax=Burkholderia gladioli TaxID=28095 RepID=UPI003B507B11
MQTIANEIRESMARAFFASAWADLQDEKDPDDPTAVSFAGGVEILSVMPDELDPAALHAARALEFGVVRGNEWLGGLDELLPFLQYSIPHGGDRPRTAEMLGHYLAMQAMGHGVGLRDAFGKSAYEHIYVPHVEFGSHSLERDY